MRKPLTICSPTPFQAAGGGFYVMRELERYLEDSGHRVVKDVQSGCDLLLINSWHVPYDTVLEVLRRNPGIPVVHRVDGSSQDYGRGEKADAKQKLVNRFADVTIFQSDYCRYSTRERFPVIGGDGPVIHNPVDLDLFTPEGPAHDLPGSTPRLAFVTFSTNPMKGWPAVYDFARQYPELTFILVGRYDDPPDLPNIHVFGKVAHENLPALLRGCDAFLAFQRNEACPNVVLEAMACGLPLLYVASGAIPELVGECGYPVDSETFRDQLQRLMENQNALATCARAHAESAFNAERLFARYREEIESAAAHRDPRRLRHWAWAWAVWLGRPIRNRLRGKNSPKLAADDRQE